MEILWLYAIFAASVGLFACYEVMAPAIRIIRKLERKDDVITDNIFLAYFTMFCVGFLAAPITLFLILMREPHEAMVEAIVFRDD